MNTKLVNSAAGVINAALTQNRTAAGVALALDSAQMLMTPETARELEGLRARVAELEAQRHVTNEALDDAVQALRKRDTGPAPYAATPEAHAQMRAAGTRHYTTARHGTCENCGSAPESWCPDCAACEQGCFGGFDGNECRHANARWRRPSVDKSPDGITQRIAPTQALREDGASC